MQPTTISTWKLWFLIRKRGSLPQPLQRGGARTARKQICSDFCSPPLEGRGEAPIFFQNTAISVQKRMFFIRNRCILSRNACFSSEIAVFCSETYVFHQKSLYFVQKRMFFIRISRILFRNACFSSELAVFCSETRVFHQKSLYFVQKRAFFIKNFCILLRNACFSSKIAVFCSETHVSEQNTGSLPQPLQRRGARIARKLICSRFRSLPLEGLGEVSIFLQNTAISAKKLRFIGRRSLSALFFRFIYLPAQNFWNSFWYPLKTLMSTGP